MSVVSRWKLALVIFVFLNGSCSTWLTWVKSIEILVELDVTMNLKDRILLITDLKYKMYFSTSKSFKQAISKDSGYGISIQLPFYVETS